MSSQKELDQQLLASVQKGDVEETKRLLELGADPNVRKEYPSINSFESLLYLASMKDSYELLKILIDAGSKVISQSSSYRPDRTALNVVLYRSQRWDADECIKAIHLLMDHGAPLNESCLSEFMSCGCGAIHSNHKVEEYVKNLLNK